MDKLIDYLSDYLEIDRDKITEDSNLVVDLGLTSYDVVEIVCDLEEIFNANINSNKISNMVTVKDIYSEIQLSKEN